MIVNSHLNFRLPCDKIYRRHLPQFRFFIKIFNTNGTSVAEHYFQLSWIGFFISLLTTLCLPQKNQFDVSESCNDSAILSTDCFIFFFGDILLYVWSEVRCTYFQWLAEYIRLCYSDTIQTSREHTKDKVLKVNLINFRNKLNLFHVHKICYFICLSLFKCWLHNLVLQ